MTLATTASPTKSLVSCSLCGLTTLHPLTNERGDVFCCPSCREVAALLAENPPTMAAPAQVVVRSRDRRAAKTYLSVGELGEGSNDTMRWVDHFMLDSVVLW